MLWMKSILHAILRFILQSTAVVYEEHTAGLFRPALAAVVQQKWVEEHN